jgi:hypothetical protein
MTIFVHDDLKDAALDYLKQNCDLMIACAGAPASYAEATTAPAGGKALADTAMAAGDFTIADAAGGGRQVSWPSKTAVPIDDAGDCDHIAFVDTGTTKLLLVAPGTATVELTSGGGETVTINGGVVKIGDGALLA